MIGRGQVEAQHPEDRPQKALRLTKGQVKDQAERQRGFDGNLGVLQLPSARADAHGLPRGDRFRRQPQGDVASLDQCSVVRRPVSDAVFRFVPGMHSRLHVEIMPLRPSRWPGPRRTLVSAHQRPVHGLQGTIRAGNEGITYYKDPHELAGRCDFVMANPPFNVDEVDAEKVKGDKRLPFGLPGVNKAKKISNANYLWLSYFYSYLNETGRAGVVMSSQASSAGRDEGKVRQKLVETGAVDVMIDIRGNFFYTRTVPCQLWCFDRAKKRDPERVNHVLMLDARNVYRKVSRAIYDFSPEQQKNITAIVWLYRKQSDRFLNLVESYLAQAVAEGQATDRPLEIFEEALGKLIDLAKAFATEKHESNPLAEIWKELTSAQAMLSVDIEALAAEVAARAANWNEGGNDGMRDNAALHAAREGLRDMAERCRDLTNRLDLAAKLAGRAVDIAVKELEARESDHWANTDINKARKALEGAWAGAVEAVRHVRYVVRQADWLQERFPEAELRDVEGLVKLVDRTEIEAHDWSLTPGRYVGVAPEEEDQDFDFEEAVRSIHIDLRGLNEEGAELAARIARNFEELGA